MKEYAVHFKYYRKGGVKKEREVLFFLLLTYLDLIFFTMSATQITPAMPIIATGNTQSGIGGGVGSVGTLAWIVHS
jgi:hypothetical protein